VNQPAPSDLPALLLAAAERRAPWHDDPRQTAYRLFHGYSEGFPGLCVDRLGDALVVTCRPEHEVAVAEALEPLTARLATRLVVAKPPRGRGEARALRGDALPVLDVVDNGLRFRVEPLAPRNEGLYLDARPARAWLLGHSRGRRVLNLFAYTGSLGAAAAAGGARSVLQVELQKRALQRAKQNLVLNGLHADDRDLIREDLYKFLRRQAKRGAAFDGIVLDPPPLVPGRGARRPTGQDFATLAPLAAPLLSPGGWLLCLFHRRERSWADSETEVHRASPVPLEVLWRGTSGDDFPEHDVESKLRFTAFARAAAPPGASTA